MRMAGASCADLAEWLKLHRCRIHRSFSLGKVGMVDVQEEALPMAA